jgi:hypothetical protein
MKIGLDIHGVLSDWETMTPIVHELRAEGHDLYVVSGAPKRELEKEIVELGYQVEWFKGVYSIIDWLLDNNAPGKIWHNEKGWWYDDDVRWWKTKAEIAEFYEIDILLDDQEKYKQGYLKPGTFTLYSTFKTFKGWKDPSSFLLKIASYYRLAQPWKLVAKEDVPVQKREPPTGRVFFVDFKCKNVERKELTLEELEHNALIEQLHRETLCGMTKAYNYLSYSKWDIERARTYARDPELLETEVEALRLKDLEYHRMQTEYEKLSALRFKKPWEDSNE